MIRMREDGILVPKSELKHQVIYNGDLKIFDTLEDGYNRVLKIAEFRTEMEYVQRLLDVEIVWMNDDRLTLKGFEQRKSEKGLIDYAQSWLITIANQSTAPDGPFGREFNKRR